MAPRTVFFRYLALFSHLGLLVWVALWQFILTTKEPYSTIFIFLIYLVPLLLPLKGIVQGKPYTHAWANFVVLFYLMHACTVLYAEPSERWYAGLELILSTAMFVGCSAFARLRGRELGQGLTKLKDEMKAEKEMFAKVKR